MTKKLKVELQGRTGSWIAEMLNLKTAYQLMSGRF